MCRISSANCFISGFTASQSTLFCKAKYSVLHLWNKWNTLYAKTRAPEKICIAKIFLENEQPLKSPRHRKAVRIKGRIATQWATICSIVLVLLRIFLKVFILVMHWKILLKKHFQLVSDFISLSPSFCFTLSFYSYESTKDKLSLYHIWTFASRFVGVFHENFTKKLPRNFSRQPRIKRKSDITQTSFFRFYF